MSDSISDIEPMGASSQDPPEESNLEQVASNEPAPFVGEELNAAATHVDNYFGHVLSKTETAKSLRDMGVSDEIPVPDVNFPALRGNEPVIFPEEYTLETETGLVPITSLQELRSRSLSQTMSRQMSRTMSRHSRLRRSTSSRIPEEEEEGSPRASETGSDLEKQQDENVEFVTFTIEDPQNPQNWSKSFKWMVTLVASGLVLAIAFGSSIVTGGLGLIQEKYNVSLEVAILTCSIMVAGFAVGPLIWSPLSEQIGRRPVYAISLTLYTILNIPCALSPNIGGLLASRFLCGVFSSSGLSLAGGTIADIWKTEERGMAIAFFAAAPYCGPVIGPIVTGWITVGSGRLSLFFWVNLAFAGAITLIVCAIPETYAPKILKSRAKRLRKETGNPNIMTEQEHLGLSLSDIVRTCLVRPIYMIATEPVLDLMNLYIVLIYALLYAFFFAYPVVFGELYGFNDGQIGLMFIPILIGAGFALCVTPLIEKQYMKICHRRNPTPEDRLVGAMIGAPWIPISLFILGATSFKHIIWVGPASSGIAFGFGMVMCYYSVNNYIIDSYQEYAASALAAKVFMRSGGGAAFPLFTTQMYHRLGLQWASWLLAFLALGMVLIPYTFYHFGAPLRAKLSPKRD